MKIGSLSWSKKVESFLDEAQSVIKVLLLLGRKIENGLQEKTVARGFFSRPGLESLRLRSGVCRVRLILLGAFSSKWMVGLSLLPGLR